MDKQVCKDILLTRNVDVIAKECISLIESCAFTLKQHFRDKEELEERDKDCISLIKVAQGNVGFFKDNSNTKIDQLKSELSKMYEDEQSNQAKLKTAKNNIVSFEEQSKQNEKKSNSLKSELKKVKTEVDEKQQELDELNKKEGNLLREKKNFEDQKIGKAAAVSKLLVDENNAQNSLNQASTDYHFVQTSQTHNNPCWDAGSPHFRLHCIKERENEMHKKQAVKDQITLQKNQAVNELSSINSQINNKINEISTVQSTISSYKQDVDNLVARQTIKNNELNSVDSTITENTKNLANEQNQISKLEADSQASFITSKKQELHEIELYFSSVLGVSNKIYSTEILGAISQQEKFIQQEEL